MPPTVQDLEHQTMLDRKTKLLGELRFTLPLNCFVSDDWSMSEHL
jgi:hypothetical protein